MMISVVNFLKKYWVELVVVFPTLLFQLAFWNVLPWWPMIHASFFWIPLITCIFVAQRKTRKHAKDFLAAYSFGGLCGALVIVVTAHVYYRYFC